MTARVSLAARTALLYGRPMNMDERLLQALETIAAGLDVVRYLLWLLVVLVGVADVALIVR